MTTIADRNMGINRQVAVLLEALSTAEIEIETPGWFWITTMPYGNCRERGFVLTFRCENGEAENIVFFEHRNSDQLCAIRWRGLPPISCAARYDDIPEENYRDKYDIKLSWPYMAINEAVRYVHGMIKEIVEAAPLRLESKA
jgi:hypothetical protein